MEHERFKAIVAAYGADPRRWPQDERAAACAYAEANAATLSGMLGEARVLDRVLETGAASEPPSDLLAARIVARAPKPAVLSRGERRAAVALAACALLGLAVGFAASSAVAPDAADAIIASAFQGDAADLMWLGVEG